MNKISENKVVSNVENETDNDLSNRKLKTHFQSNN